MRKRTTALVGVGLLAAATATFGSTPANAAGSDGQTTAGSRVVGHTYVNDNTANVNTLAGFDRHADGSLSPIAGSPFAIGGAGLGSGLGSQGALQTTPDHRYLLAVDAGSSEISVLRLGRHGVPRLVGRPVPSGGTQPVSITISEAGLVYVANVGDGGSNYTGFRLDEDGLLTAIPRSTVAVPEGSGVGDVLFNSTGDRLVGTRVNTSLIDSFSVAPNGRLVAAQGSPFTAQDLGPFGAEFRPTNASQLFVSNAHAGAGLGTVSAFDVSRTGVLDPVGPAFPNGQTAPCWVEISHDGNYLFAVNTASATVSSYSITAKGSLVLIGTTPFTNGLGAVDARLSPDGTTLSVTGGRGQVVSSFAVQGGELTELASSPTSLPTGSFPTGLVVV
jgi:6-phosphogluconolactonase (cycloisomerase 2 family)